MILSSVSKLAVFGTSLLEKVKAVVNSLPDQINAPTWLLLPGF
ncbi:MAG TPA: hypothetical protein VKV19_12530 [Ktedonobacteraceae bacterium]|nr:hypothetical protein [Ktedonobacteraceae bacterium]